MSFLKDDITLARLLAESELLNQLLKTAQLSDPVRELAAKLATNLRNQLDVSSETPEADLFARDLKNFDDFIAYLYRHKTVFNGAEIVLDADTRRPPEDLKNKYVKYESKFIYAEGVENFLNQLKKHADDAGNKLMQAMLGRLIIDANNKLGTSVSAFEAEEAKPEEESKEEVSDDTELDQLPSTIDLDKSVDALMTEKGDFKLLAKHLKEENFSIIRQHFLLKKKGETHSLEDKPDLCSFLNYLYNRALHSGNAFYQEKVKELASTNGCEVFDYAKPDETAKEVSKKPEAAPKATPEEAATSVSEQDILSNLPFVEGGIDIRRMETFLEKITHFLDIGGAISQANRNTVAQIVQNFHNLKTKWISSLPSQIGGTYANGPSDFNPADLEAQNKMISDFGSYPAVINSSIILRSLVKSCLDTLSIIGRDARLKNIIGSLKEQVGLGNSYYQALYALIENTKSKAREVLG